MATRWLCVSSGQRALSAPERPEKARTASTPSTSAAALSAGSEAFTERLCCAGPLGLGEQPLTVGRCEVGELGFELGGQLSINLLRSPGRPGDRLRQSW